MAQPPPAAELRDGKEYIRLIGQVIAVRLDTVKIVSTLPDLGLPKGNVCPGTHHQSDDCAITTTVQ